MTYTLGKINDIIAGQQVGTCDTLELTLINTDTRTIKSGELFIALHGDNFDGHDFIIQAKQRGAVAAIVSRAIDVDLPHICVPDTRKALGQLAAFARQQHPLPVLAITGSCGKTTTKAMLTSIMERSGKVLSPPGSYNNDIGLPLTLLKLTGEHQYAVIELGANKFGEINYLTNIAKPTVATVLNVGSAHLAGFGDEQGVAKEKGTIFNGLDQNGIAVINKDDRFADYFVNLNNGRKLIFFSVNQTADVCASDIKTASDGKVSFKLHMASQDVAIKLPTLGQHNVANALAAAACAHAAGVSIDYIKLGLENMSPVTKRLITYPGKNNSIIIDDSYNAIPNAVTCALQVLATMPSKKIFVFGGMAELGEDVITPHRNVGAQARELGIDKLFAIGEHSKQTTDAFGEQGFYFERKQDLIPALQQELAKDVTLLIKGSRGARMEEVVAALRQNEGDE